MSVESEHFRSNCQRQTIECLPATSVGILTQNAHHSRWVRIRTVYEIRAAAFGGIRSHPTNTKTPSSAAALTAGSWGTSVAGPGGQRCGAEHGVAGVLVSDQTDRSGILGRTLSAMSRRTLSLGRIPDVLQTVMSQ